MRNMWNFNRMSALHNILGFSFIVLAAWLCSGNAAAQQSSAQQSSATPGFACFENLTAPQYPEVAVHDRVDGSVWAWVHLNAQGAIESVNTDVVSAWSNGKKLLTPPVEKVIGAATAKPNCDGKTVTVVFRFQLEGDTGPNAKVTSQIEGPDLMAIESPLSTRPTDNTKRKGQ